MPEVPPPESLPDSGTPPPELHGVSVQEHGDAFELRNRKDVDALQAYLEGQGVRIVDPAGEYYEDYYAVFFLDPDGLKLEGMKYGELTAKRRRRPAASKKKKA